jgi:hypothetical protein
MAAGPLQEFTAPIFTGPDGVVVGLGVAVGAAVAVELGVAVGVAVGADVAVEVGAGVFSFSLPQANNTGAINASTRNRAANLCQKLIFVCLISYTSYHPFSSEEACSSNPSASHIHVGTLPHLLASS